MRDLVLIAHNLRSAHNVGSLLRTAEGLGVSRVFLTGYTPYPQLGDDQRLPHLVAKTEKQIDKTALGAQKTLDWHHSEEIDGVITKLKNGGYSIVALEQSPKSVSLPELKPPERLAIIVGREVEGVEPEVLDQCDAIVEIPMFGKKESYNVVQAAAMALYHCRFPG